MRKTRQIWYKLSNIAMVLAVVLLFSGAVQAQEQDGVSMVWQDELITGALLSYNWATQTGTITDFRTEVDGLIITGQKATVQGETVYIQEASITKCDLAQPEFELYTKLLTFNLESKRLTTKGTWIKVYGHKVIPEPSISVVLDDSRFGRESREGLPKPIVGVDSTRGVYAGATYQTLPTDNMLLRSTLIYGSKSKLEGDFSYIGRVGDKGTLTASWVRNPELDYPLGGVRFDYVVGLGDLALVAGQYEEENERTIQYLPELRFSGERQDWRWGKLGLYLTPQASLGYLRSKDDPAKEAYRLSSKVGAGWKYSFTDTLYLSGSGGIKFLGYSSPENPEPYLELAETTYLKKRVGNSTFGIGHQWTDIQGSPLFGELDKGTAANNGLLSYEYSRGWSSGTISASTTFKYDLDKEAFSTGVYGARITRKGPEVSFGTSLGVEQDLADSQIKTVSYGANLDWAGDWLGAANLKYDLSDDEWDSGELSLIRKLHCYDLKVEYDLVQERIGTKVIFNW